MTRNLTRRLPHLAGVLLLSAIAATAAAKAATIDFSYTGSIVSYTVPVSGVYEIDSFGAQGGVNAGISGPTGGLGAQAGGEFSLMAGQTLSILVGGQGGNGSGLDGGGGGGGGSFVSLVGASFLPPGCGSAHGSVCPLVPDTPLVIAGGGGGAGTLWSGVGGQSGTSGAGGHITGGTGGGGGAGAGLFSGGGGGFDGAGGGGGYLGNGFGGNPDNACDEGGGVGCGGASILPQSFFGFVTGTGGGAGGAGGCNDTIFGCISTGGSGGFGGGGGAAGAGAGGGGGGSSGGGGGDAASGGGGGGSYLDSALLFSAMDEVLAGGVESGNGEVTITFESATAVPEPRGLLLLGTGLLGFVVFAHRGKSSIDRHQ